MSANPLTVSSGASSSPIVVLVHGALTDASIWNAVADRLQRQGLRTIAPAMPLRGLQSDAAYLAALVHSLDGPFLLVGHSYAGTVISHPALQNERLRGLVFVSAFLPASGESTAELNSRWPGSRLGESTIIVRPYPSGQELYLNPEHFAHVYAADLPATVVSVMAAAQRPIDVAALQESFTGSPTWQDVRSWALLSTADNSLPLEAQRFMARRAKSSTVEVEASHASPISQAGAVADLIGAAVQSALADDSRSRRREEELASPFL